VSDQGLSISVAAEPIFYIGNLAITNSFLCTYIVIGLFIIVGLLYKKSKSQKEPGKLALLLDMLFEGLLSFFKSVAGEKAVQFFPLLSFLFLYIMFSNWLGLLPGFGSIGVNLIHHGEKLHHHLLRGPTADLNMTFALAIISVGAIQYFGVKNLGISYFKKFFDFSNPIMLFVGLLELVSEFSKMISFSFRLFGNIFAGEVLLAVMGFLLPFFAPLPFLGLEVFVGFIHALVFTMLSLVFMNLATQSHGNNNHNHEKHEEAEEGLEKIEVSPNLA